MAWIQVVLKIFDKLAIFILCCNCSTKNTSITWHGFLGQLPLQFLGWTSEPHHLRGSGSVPRFRTFFYPGVVLTGICLIQVTSCKNAYLYVHICKYWHLNILYIYIMKHGQNLGFTERLLSTLVNPLSFCIAYHCSHLYGMVFGIDFMCNPSFCELRTKRGCSGPVGRFQSFAKNQEVSVYWHPFPPQKTSLSKAILLAPSNSGNWGLLGIPQTKKGYHASCHWY